MKLLATLFIAGLLAFATAAPAPAEVVAVQTDIPTELPHFDGNVTLTLKPGQTLQLSRREVVEKRAVVHVDYWENSDKGGRHGTSDLNTDQCYNFINGWNDIISSLQVQSGYHCIWFEDQGCNMNDYRLYVHGKYEHNLQEFNFNDIISSILCYT